MNCLIEEAGSVNEFVNRTGMPQPFVSQIRSKNINKNMGDKSARKIEQAFNKPGGWMDKLHHLEDEAPSQSLQNRDVLVRATSNIINELIHEGVYDQLKEMDHNTVANFIVDEYEKLLSMRNANKDKSA